MRQYWIDYLRCLAILGVICIHVSATFYNEFLEIDISVWWIADIINSASRFAVPLFVMISGCLLLGRDFSISEFYKKRLLRLFLPFLFWSLFYFIFKIFTEPTGCVKMLFASFFFMMTYYHLWYLPMFICLMAFAPFINKMIIGKKLEKNDVLILIGLFFILFTLTWCSGLLKLKTTKYSYDWFKAFPLYICYFILGYYISRLNLKARLFKIKNMTILMTIMTISLLGAVFNYILCKYLKILRDQFILDNLSPFMLIVTSFIFMYFYKNKDFLKKNKVIEAFADASFGIYLIHPFFLYFFQKIPNYFKDGYFYIPFVICCLMLVSFLSIYFIRKSKFGRLIC